MEAVKSLSDLLSGPELKLTKEEKAVLEAELFTQIYKEFMERMQDENKDYFRLLKINNEKEKPMIETNYIRCIISDILATQEYTLPGIAYYTDTPEEIILDVVSGRNNNPTFFLSQKVIDLHRSVRPQLYQSVLRKIYHNNNDQLSAE